MSILSTGMFVAAAVLPSFVLAWIGCIVVRRQALNWGLVDVPDARKAHSRPVPLGGGLAMWAAVILTFAVGQLALVLNSTVNCPPVPEFAKRHLPGLVATLPQLWFLLGAATAITALGLADDWVGLNWRSRLVVQLVLAAAVVWGQGWRLTFYVDVPALTGIASVLWIVGLTNSFNMLDNMDGLSAGVAAIAIVVLVAVLLLAPDPETQAPQLFVAGLLLVLLGAVLGFWLHNRHPASLFMGDAGSYFLGFTIAVATLIATFAGYRAGTGHTILAPLCALAVPLYDTFTVVGMRLRAGRSPFEPDRNHFSHRLVELGLTEPQAVRTIYLLTATCGLGALLLHRVDTLGAVIVLLLVGCVLLLIGILESTARSKLRE
jgi:UDP-GlcNAc:undecaprenyl-phosphate GlcNAc-1-phosphate transferase